MEIPKLAWPKWSQKLLKIPRAKYSNTNTGPHMDSVSLSLSRVYMDHTSNCMCICKTWFFTMSQNESQKVSSKLCSKVGVLQPHCTRLMQIARYSWLSWHVASVWCLVIGKGYQNPTWRRSNPKSRWGLEKKWSNKNPWHRNEKMWSPPLLTPLERDQQRSKLSSTQCEILVKPNEVSLS